MKAPEVDLDVSEARDSIMTGSSSMSVTVKLVRAYSDLVMRMVWFRAGRVGSLGMVAASSVSCCCAVARVACCLSCCCRKAMVGSMLLRSMCRSSLQAACREATPPSWTHQATKHMAITVAASKAWGPPARRLNDVRAMVQVRG